MARYYSCLGVQRVLMPTVLIFCALLRPVGISLVYLIMFFIIPFVPVANKKNIRGSVGAYFIILIAISTLLIVSHIGLQVAEILLGKISVDCNFLEFLLRHIGFVSLRNLSPLDVVEWIIPEIIMFLTSVIFYILLKRLTTDKPIEPHGGDESVVGETHLEEGLVRSNKKTEQISQATMENMKKLGPFISLVTLLLASALRPSVPGGFYFLIYLISGTYWACFKSLRRGFGIVLRFVMIVLVFHIISIISYQTPWPQEHIGNSSLTARLVGLEALCISTCKSGDDIRIIEYSEKFEFDSFLSPISMLLCYYILSLTSNILIQKKLVRRNTRAGQNIIKRTSDQRSIASTNIPLETLSEQPEDEEPAASILDQLWYGVLSIVEFVYQNSYIFTNITMMAWSIIYHSWLTFVLLIWANILWMIPNQRKAMLRSSPFIVFYAELLLIAQYIYGMNLTELPSDVDGIKLIQIGFEKPLRLPCAPLLVKSLFTIMFWITLRQLFKEAKEKRQSSVLADMVAPLQMAVGAATADLAPKVDEKKTSKFLQKFGEFFKVVLVKLWIWLLVFVIFLSAITGSKMTGFRICYMALFLFFLLAFQLSWRAWTRIMYGFWLVLITYAMSILILVYTYQFDEVRLIWKDYLNMSKVLRNDLGLESYATKDLFLHLVNPTVIVIMTIIQIHYFHKKFLASLEVDITNIETPASNTTSANFAENVAQQPSSNDQSPTEKSEFFGDDGKTTLSGKLGKLNSLRRMSKKQIEMMFVKIQTSSKNLVEFIWTFLEIHLMKLVYFIAFLFCLSEVCLLHVFFIFMIVIAIMSKTQAQIYISRLMSIIVSALLLTKMIYQVHYIDHGNYNVSCVTNSTTDDGQEFNNAVWFGLRKRTSDEKLASLLKGYILFMIFLTIHAVVIFRQEHMRASRSLPNNRPHVIFANVTRKDAERNIYGLIKYLLNYGYFKFGIEITLIGLVSLIGFRQDIIAILYSVWLCILFLLERSKCSKLWPFLQWFAAIIIPIQYMLFVGVPPILCPKYTWDNSTYKNGLENWAMLPGPNIQNQSSKLIFDFVLLMFICRQARVFSIEKRFDNDSLEFPGGTNKSIIREIDNLGSIPFENPTPDFIANVRNWLDIFKIIVLTGSFWVTLAVVFLAGTNIISLFSIGYLIGSFIFLWQGTDFYLRPIAKILRWWNILLAYNVAVITIKTFLQIAGCFFLSTLEENACWLVHLLGISCIRGDVNESNEPNIIGKCRDTKDVTGLTWDAICFAFLLFQLRIFKSHYICHIINDTKASTILASRGAELIEDLRQKQIQHKAKHEREVLRKIKKKMEKIRANQQKQLKPIEKTTHFDEYDFRVASTTVSRKKPPITHAQAIRAGDYYMFNDLDEKIELDLMEEEKDFLEEQGEISESEKKMNKRKDLLQHDEKSEKDIKLSDKPSTSKESEDLTDSKLNKSDFERQEQSKKDEDETELAEEAGLLIRLFEGFMVSIAIRLNRLSRNYRYVMKILAKEKKILKESDGFGAGARKGAGSIWTPFRFIKQTGSSDGDTINTLNSQTDTNEHNTDKLKQSDSDNDAETGTKVIEKDAETIYYTPRQELQPFGVMAESIQDDIDDYEDDFTTREHHILIEVLIALWYAILSNTDMVCYLIVFINQVASASLLSLPLPFMVFLWGTLALPRPTKKFWVTLIAYTQLVVLIKFVFQFKVIWSYDQIKRNPLSTDKVIGIEAKDNYAAYDLLLLLILFFHRFVLKSQGLWNFTYKDDIIPDIPTENGSSSHDVTQGAIATKEDLSLITPKESSVDESVVKDDVVILPDKGEDIVDPVSSGQDSVENSGKRKLHEEVKITAIKYGTSIIQFFKDLIYKPRLPTDVYACTFLCDFINFFVLLFGFAAFGSQQGDGGVQAYLEENKVPIPFLIMLLIQFLLILIDRALYLRRALVYKIMFHFALVIGVHIWMFFVIPAVTERDFNSNLAPIIFYIIKCCGLLLSSYQIKCGYPSRILGNFLTRGFSLVNMIAFKIYMSMPFLYELRTFMDWVCTDSTMTLFDWLKMEDIFSSIFFLKCGRQMETDLPAARAQKKSIVTKIIMGGSIILLLIVLIWAPLTLFALANTVGQSNIPYDITISLKMGPYEPVYEMSAQDSSIHQFDDKMVGKFYEYFAPNKVAISFLLGYDSGDIAAMVLGANSTSLWSISPPDRERLLYDLIQNNTLTCRFKYTLTRKTNNQEKNPGVISSETTFEMDEYYPGRKKLISMLEGTNTTNDSIILPNIFPKFLKVKNSGTLGIIPQLLKPEIEYQNLYLKLFMSGDQNQFNSWWEVKEDCNGTDYQSIYSHLPYTQCSTNIVIYTFNDKLFSSAVSFLAAGGIVGMYTTFVIVAAKFLRGSISGTSKSIMFDELPYVDRVLQLCLDIYLVREALEFALEEDLFAKLLFLYRSPEMMIKWTRPKEENTDEDDEEETESVRSRTSRTSSRRRPE